ncbi:Zinc finger Ran-binding domain-containing protein 2 [Trichoplax sp. H2]|nr:Zinc finger Ran-binding domain-containing protein 2 [Trichoplax sp. H2]|eukprot:RDD38004.1 Zinc finger Ran-binding domain-containing protein 2 [Trichoplax sp. H2]
MSGRGQKAAGDWECPDSSCGNVNFAWRKSCNRCGKGQEKKSDTIQKPKNIGKNAATKSGGLFSAEDWQCSKCGNVNWSRRLECNICKTAKFIKVEHRSGFGGGYYERDNVEYINRDESDGEYDDFGRKKKKFRRVGDEDGTDAQEYEDEPTRDEEEDEEDVEEEDAGKYDLSGFGDEEEDSDGSDDADLLKYDLGTPSDDNSNDGGVDRVHIRAHQVVLITTRDHVLALALQIGSVNLDVPRQDHAVVVGHPRDPVVEDDLTAEGSIRALDQEKENIDRVLILVIEDVDPIPDQDHAIEIGSAGVQGHVKDILVQVTGSVDRGQDLVRDVGDVVDPLLHILRDGVIN